MLYIYSKDKDLYGYGQMLVSMAYLLLPLATFGLGGVVIRFFREFKTKDYRNHGFLSLVILLYFSSISLFLLYYYFFKGSIYQLLELAELNTQMLKDNEITIVLLILLFLAGVLDYSSLMAWWIIGL